MSIEVKVLGGGLLIALLVGISSAMAQHYAMTGLCIMFGLCCLIGLVVNR
jgi:hypothetical protein